MILNCVQVRARVPFADGEWSKLVPVGKIKMDLYSTVYSCAIIARRLCNVIFIKKQLNTSRLCLNFVEFSFNSCSVLLTRHFIAGCLITH